MFKNFYIYIILVLLLICSGVYINSLRNERTELASKNEKLEATLISTQKKVKENNTKLHTLQAANSVLEQEKVKNSEKAIKDVTRVQKIVDKKSKLYEKLVNRDFRKTQEEWRNIAK